MGQEIWIIIVGMALVTFIPRVIPFFIISGEKMHPALKEWLRLLPIVIFASMIAPPLLTGDGQIAVTEHLREIGIVLTGAIVAYFTKKIPLSLGAAVIALFLINFLS